MNVFDDKHIWHPYAKIPNEIATHLVTSASGVYLNLENGNKIIDGMSSWWAVIHGYNHPVLNKAINKQLEKMAHIMFGGLTHKPAINLAKTLIDITPKDMNKVFFSDSGSVAVEVAMKMALQYWQNKNKPNKNKFITCFGGYHGDTFGAMSVCDPDNGMHHLFSGVLPQHFFAKQPSFNNIETALNDLENILIDNHKHIAAMILEPIVQGAGGMNIYPPKYLLAARKLCSKFNVLFILDEIATGFGRTGKLFALEYANITPDILCLGKSMTGGYLSLAATITTENVANEVGTLMHGPTFMANPLACAVANASIKLLLKSDWQTKIKNIEKILTTELLELKNHRTIKDVRVLGAIGVVETIEDINVEEVQKNLIDNGVWLRPYGKLLYTMPPLIISDNELLQITNAIKNTVKYL